ncbi:MAG: glycosyltransferase family 9 protein, partial [Alphaproteobacteria bacterium]|nr:glycosyltransferase family 9 protein [Alphaproteobacteria bacterium]
MAILVIKLGALGDFVQALGPFAAIRHHHADTRIILLTTTAYRELAEASRFFDDVWTGGRPSGLDIGGWLVLRRRMRGGGVERVYDLQTSDRSSFYRNLFWPAAAPEWSGIARGCSHPHTNPDRDVMHTVERQAEQLSQAGIAKVPPVDLAGPEWKSDVSRFELKDRFILLAPGGAAHRPEKRWPSGNFVALAKALVERGITPVCVGTEEALIDSIS